MLAEPEFEGSVEALNFSLCLRVAGVAVFWVTLRLLRRRSKSLWP